MPRNSCVHIVDDDASVRESLKTLLGGYGYQVHCYHGAEAFLEYGDKVTGCAVVDLRMPGMDGIVLQKEISARRIAVEVIMISAYGDIERAVTAMRLGAADFLEKPFNPEALVNRVESLMHADRDPEEAKREARRHVVLVDTLTQREKQVLALVADGLANKQVAARLGISARTVETHRVHVMQKLGAVSVAHLVRIWLNAQQGNSPAA